MQNLKVKRQVEPKLNEKEQIINTSQTSTDTHHTSPESYLVGRQQAVHDGQLGPQLANLTVQATNSREDYVLLLPVLQEDVVASEIHHISLQMLDSGLEVRLLMLKPHPLKQRLLVLLQVLTATEPPVTNY
jgi:hypothetical protein